MSLREKLQLLWSDVWDIIAPFVRLFLTKSGQALAEIALSAVVKVASDPSILTGEAKRNKAFNMILVELKARGITIATSVINTAIEVAVQKMKDQYGK